MSAPSKRVCARVKVCGRVQGVFFRAETVLEAVRYGLGGWVRNCYDGSVEAHFEGDRASVDALINWCRHGPPAAQVDKVEVNWCEPENMRDFRIAY